MKTRRILAMIVAAVLLIATVSVIGILSVSAEVTTITTAEQFAELDGKSGEYKLGGNITLTGTVPSFSGTLDGNGCTVTVSAPVFGTLSGEVKNLTIAGAITSDETTPVGALANTVSGTTTVTNVTNSASVTSTQNKVAGGFIGLVEGNTNFTVTFANCTNTGAVSGGYGVGGFVGRINNTSATTSNYSNVTFSYCLNDAAIAGKAGVDHDAGTGGLVGFSKTRGNVVMTYCGNTENGIITDVGGDYGVGGLYGGGTWTESDVQKYDISYSYNKGSVTSDKTARPGGIVGRLNRRSGSVGHISYCYNTGAINGKGSNSAGILGYTNSNNVASISYCYTIGSLVTGSKGITYDAGGKVTQTSNFTTTDKEALNEALLALTDSEYCVNPDLNDGYAILKWQCEHSEPDCEGKCDYCAEVVGEAGEHSWSDWAEKTPATATHAKVEERTCSVCSGTEEQTVGDALGLITPVDGVYTVANENQLVWLFYKLNSGEVAGDANVVLSTNITLTNGLELVKKKYSGVFDGKGHTISGLNNTLFYEFDGTIQDITLEGDINYVLAGGVDNDEIRCAASVAMNARKGYVVRNVVSNINISLTAENINAGGILGFANAGVIENVTYGGTYTVKWIGSSCAVGGIVGWLNDDGNRSELTNCYFTGSISATSDDTFEKDTYYGGIIGRARYGSSSACEIITGCVNTGSLTVTVKSNDVRVGGIVASYEKTGMHEINNTIFNGTIEAPTATMLGNLVGNGTVSVTDSFDLTAEEKVGDPFTMGGVTYQKYAFGYVNATTSALVSTGMVASNAIDAYISLRQNADDHDVRFVLLADMEALADVAVADVTITFKLGDETVKTVTKKFGGDANDFIAYEAVLAAGEPYFAKEGYAFFGLVVIDIPNGAWDSVTLTVTNASDSSTILAPVAAEYEANNG